MLLKSIIFLDKDHHLFGVIIIITSPACIVVVVIIFLFVATLSNVIKLKVTRYESIETGGLIHVSFLNR